MDFDPHRVEVYRPPPEAGVLWHVMAGLRPFRGLRYTEAAGALGSLLSAPSGTLTPHTRDDYALRNPNNAIALASPEGHGDDRSKYIRYARSAAKLADWRRQDLLAAEERPAFYRLTQTFNTDSVHTALIAVADLQNTVPGETPDPKIKEDRLRLLEATRTTFEPAIAYFDDPDGSALQTLLNAPGHSETVATVDGITSRLEAIDDPAAIAAIEAAFSGKTFLVGDGVESVEAARAFREGLYSAESPVPEDGTLLVLSSLEDHSFALQPVHPVIRRFPGGPDLETILARLSTRFAVEAHQNRNLEIHLQRANDENRIAFGMATQGGAGYLLTPLTAPDGPASLWLQREIFSGLFGIPASEPFLYFNEPIHAIRAADEGAAAAFLMPRARRADLVEARRQGVTLPHRSLTKFPWAPTGIVMWAMGDDA